MLLLEIPLIHSNFETSFLWADVTLKSRIFLWTLQLWSPLPLESTLWDNCNQFLAYQCIWWNVDLVVICNTTLANVDSLFLIKLKAQFLSVISKLWCVLNLCLYCLYPENFGTAYSFSCKRRCFSFWFQLFAVIQESLYPCCDSQELPMAVSLQEFIDDVTLWFVLVIIFLMILG